jgi:hypothetical protein
LPLLVSCSSPNERAARCIAIATSPTYHGRSAHPRELLGPPCLRGSFSSGTMTAWELERDGEVVRVDPRGLLVVRAGGATDLAVA